jgi:hypothetical protein
MGMELADAGVTGAFALVIFSAAIVIIANLSVL